MLLSVKERFLILSGLQLKGDIIFLKMRNILVKKVGLNEEEIAKYEIKNDEGKVTWRIDLPQDTEIELTGMEMKLISDELVDQDKAKTLTPDHVSLYEKFVERNTEEDKVH